LTNNQALAILKIHINSSSEIPDYKRIEKGIASLTGVKNVQINLTTNCVKVDYDPELLSVKKIRERLGEL
jgi:hypothetical protein